MDSARKVDLYNGAYSNYGLDFYRQVRIATYGEDLGQTSWVSAEESDQIPELLQLTAEYGVLEIGCGSGRFAMRLAERIGCRMVAVDLNSHAIETATAMAQGQPVQIRFQQVDASKPLPFESASFNAAFSNDAMCHIPARLAAMRELFRVLKPGGRLLFSDALVIAGAISHEEIAARSSIGSYIFSPPGENERLLRQAGFEILTTADSTAAAASIAKRWRDAREHWREDLVKIEGADKFEGLQAFLASVHTLTSERRLLRMVYVASR